MWNLNMESRIKFYILLSLTHISCGRNVLILLGDDFGFESGLYGNKVSQTPHIDKLGKSGLVFDSAYTSVSSCSPSRSSLLTGIPCHQNGMYGLENGYHHFQSFDQVRSLSNILQDHHVYTGIIGKKHVAPEPVYRFNYSRTELDGYSVTQVGRNITYIKLLTREFLQKAEDRPFLLYVGFHDAHRCGHTDPRLGSFCEKFGDASIPGMGVIPDWKPVVYTPDQVEVPYFVPDTPASREDLAAQYKTISRLDQGVGVILEELKMAGVYDDTLVIFSSDNGIPFPNGRTNMYQPGIREPFILSNPHEKSSWGKRTDKIVTLLDVVPTVLDWFNVSFPSYEIWHKPVQLTGKSLLPLTRPKVQGVKADYSVGFVSQSLHEVTMFYPMRTIHTAEYKLIHNTNYRMPFPIDQDFYISRSFQDILNRTVHGDKLPWYKNLSQYYNRPRWEFYNLQEDPKEVDNLYTHSEYSSIIHQLKTRLYEWLNVTADPWICAPDGVLEDAGDYKQSPKCLPLYNNV